MRRLFLTLLTISCCRLLSAQALEKIIFMPQWTPQSQFAGFYIALEHGFYEDEGLDVTIRHIGSTSTISVQTLLLRGDVQIAVQQMLQSVIARSNGADLVNVFQITQHTGLMCVGHSKLDSVKDLDGLKIGYWKSGYAEICEILSYFNNVNINWIPFINGINLFVMGAVDATLCYSYSEYLQLLLARGEIPEENVLRFPDMGVDGPEDGLFVTGKYYATHKDTVDKFVRATKRGWDYVRSHKKEAVDLSMRYCEEGNIATNRILQEMMLDEYLKLQINPGTGTVDYADITREQFDIITDYLFKSNMILSRPTYNEMIK